MSDQPFIYKNPRVGLAVVIMAIGGMFGGSGYGAYSVSEVDENVLRTNFKEVCVRRAAALGDITEQGSTLTSTFSLSDVNVCLDASVERSMELRSNAIGMMKIGGLIMLLGGTLLIPSRKDNSNGPKPPRH